MYFVLFHDHVDNVVEWRVPHRAELACGYVERGKPGPGGALAR